MISRIGVSFHSTAVFYKRSKGGRSYCWWIATISGCHRGAGCPRSWLSI